MRVASGLVVLRENPPKRFTYFGLKQNDRGPEPHLDPLNRHIPHFRSERLRSCLNASTYGCPALCTTAFLIDHVSSCHHSAQFRKQPTQSIPGVTKPRCQSG